MQLSRTPHSLPNIFTEFQQNNTIMFSISDEEAKDPESVLEAQKSVYWNEWLIAIDIASSSAPEITSSYVMTWVRVGVNRAQACTIQVASCRFHSVLSDSIEFWTMYSISLS